MSERRTGFAAAALPGASQRIQLRHKCNLQAYTHEQLQRRTYFTPQETQTQHSALQKAQYG